MPKIRKERPSWWPWGPLGAVLFFLAVEVAVLIGDAAGYVYGFVVALGLGGLLVLVGRVLIGKKDHEDGG